MKVQSRVARFPMIGFCLTLIVALAAALAISPAEADTSHDLNWKPDTGQHTWCFGTTFSFDSYANAAMNNLENQTVVDMAQNCNDANVDALWVNIDEGPFIYGQWTCRTTIVVVNDVNVCRSAFVGLSPSVIQNAPTPGAQATKTACHELGHSVGLDHYTGPPNPSGFLNGVTDCMRSGDYLTNWGSSYNRYHPHHVAHINYWFNL